ncbi:MAG: hypothetical protein JNM27_14095 [Leptospirales bacterium]|nr:hypothetical protein [Leptospirales bacterium]
MQEWIPARSGFFPGLLARFMRAVAKTDAPMAQTLAWYPRALLGAGFFELFSARSRRFHRVLNLIRLSVSFTVSCPWCVQMNSASLKKNRITEEELRFLNGSGPQPVSILAGEAIAIEYARQVSCTPVQVSADVAENMKANYSEKEMVMISWTAAQVNFFSRLFQSWMIGTSK